MLDRELAAAVFAPPLLGEIMCRLDAVSLCNAAAVSRGWLGAAGDDPLWRQLCVVQVAGTSVGSLGAVDAAAANQIRRGGGGWAGRFGGVFAERHRQRTKLPLARQMNWQPAPLMVVQGTGGEVDLDAEGRATAEVSACTGVGGGCVCGGACLNAVRATFQEQGLDGWWLGRRSCCCCCWLTAQRLGGLTWQRAASGYASQRHESGRRPCHWPCHRPRCLLRRFTSS